MPDDVDTAQKVRKLLVDHAETRWLTLRLDTDVQEIRVELRAVRETQALHTDVLASHTAILREHTTTLAEHSATLAEHTDKLDSLHNKVVEHDARFDSIDGQLRSLTQMVGQVLSRLPEQRTDEP